MNKTNYRWILGLVLAAGILMKLAWLGHPTDYYFDEVYHAYTARQYIHANPDAYDPWGRAPEGVANEWTHPPLAKLLMAGLMLVFGENAFGWRIGSVIFGTVSIGMAALISRELFKSERASLITALLLTIDGLMFTQSRIAMNDTYFIGFSLIAIYCYILWRRKKRAWLLWLGGMVLGLALASKWTALYVIAAIGIDFLIRSAAKLPKINFMELLGVGVSYLVVPIMVYLFSYVHYFGMGFEGKDFVELQRQMFWYHTNLTATHPFQSRPWQWMLDLRPVWYYTNYDKADFDLVGNIYNLANPILVWGGLVMVTYAGYRWVKERKWSLGFSLLLYFGLFAPWFFSPRIMFFYHYLPSLIWLAIITGWGLDLMLKKGQYQALARIYLGVATLWFVIFYPNMVGLYVPRSVFEGIYTFIPSWK